MIHPLLKTHLELLDTRQRQLRFWAMLAACWAIAGFAGLGLMVLENLLGFSSWIALPLVLVTALVLVVAAMLRLTRKAPDWRALAHQVEAEHRDLDGRLLTAIQQELPPGAEFSYLQERVVQEALADHERSNWSDLLPASRIVIAQTAHVAALVFLGVVLWGLRVPAGTHHLIVSRSEGSITVTPGDVSLESGSSLVVMARFVGRLPSKVELVLDPPPAIGQRVPLVKNLADPLFGATVPNITSNLLYHLEYAGQRTRDFKATIFEYPRLERSDADVKFPDYTRQSPRHLENTRRVTAVEGSRLDLVLQLNKLVSSASLITADTNRVSLPLVIDTNRPLAALKSFPLEATKSYELQLVDFEGRTNRLPARFVFDVLKNRTPELQVASPRGDTRPSPLEEVAFDGTVWDDFGVQAYGLAWSVPGKPPTIVELGRDVPGKEKRPFHFLLRLEELGVQPDDLISWFLWADDLGPDGRVRRTSGDMFFAEVRPFEEIFREGQSMSAGGDQDQQASGGSQATRLVELQKQIINATWKLLRQQGGFSAPSHTTSDTNDPPQHTSVLHPDLVAQSELRPDLVAQILNLFRISDFGFRISTSGLVAQRAPAEDPSEPPPLSRRGGPRSSPQRGGALTNDLGVVSDAQAQALDQAQEAKQRQRDPKSAALWDAATRQMQRALDHLRAATNSPAAFQEAVAAEQAAYQALLRLQEREYSVSRSRNRQAGGGGRQQQMQRQLEQLDLTDAKDRYQTERQARSPLSTERREQLQVMNRLQELAQRQQDVNERLKELQTALQEARTEKEREEIRRQLKSLEQEQQQMLADADELRQRLERPENQSRMTEQRQQLEQARNDLQRAADATQQGQPTQALASGTRAQRQLQQMRDDLRRQSAGEFDQDLRQMRADARDLARAQEELQKQIDSLNDPKRRTLSDADANKTALEQLAKQSERLTNLVNNATQLSQQAEQAEPLMSRELYDTLRKFAQDETGTAKQFQEELLSRGMVSQELLDRLKESSEKSGTKSLDLTSEMLRQGYLPDAALADERARAGINDLKRGVERAAASVLGDDAESLRLAGQELDRLAVELEREMAQAAGGATNTQQQASASQVQPNGQPADQATTPNPQPSDSAQNAEGNGTKASQNLASSQPSQADAPAQQGERSQQGDNGSNNLQAGGDNRTDLANANQANAGPNGGRFDIERFFDDRGGWSGGPITGGDYGPWSDALRNVEELVDAPWLRSDVARARERARELRREYRRDQKKPDWAVVRLQVLKPLVEVRRQINEELSRREPQGDLVPIDRDPVPGRYSELVRRYYQELGMDNRSEGVSNEAGRGRPRPRGQSPDEGAGTSPSPDEGLPDGNNSSSPQK